MIKLTGVDYVLQFARLSPLRILDRSKRQGLFLPVACPIEGSNQISGFVGDIHLAVRQAFFVQYLTRFGVEEAFAFGSEKIDVRGDR